MNRTALWLAVLIITFALMTKPVLLRTFAAQKTSDAKPTAIVIRSDEGQEDAENTIEKENEEMEPIGVLSFTMKTIDNKDKPLSDYKGDVLLVVNTASFCGNTPQYKSMEKMYEKYRAKGLRILAFPANEFGKQEPGSNSEIKQFCTTHYDITFDLFSKIVVKGREINPLYKYLTTAAGFDGDIKWNFEKFLVDRDGKVVARYAPRLDPLSSEVTTKIEELLDKK